MTRRGFRPWEEDSSFLICPKEVHHCSPRVASDQKIRFGPPTLGESLQAFLRDGPAIRGFLLFFPCQKWLEAFGRGELDFGSSLLGASSLIAPPSLPLLSPPVEPSVSTTWKWLGIKFPYLRIRLPFLPP